MGGAAPVRPSQPSSAATLEFLVEVLINNFWSSKLYILLSLFLINASTDLAQIFRGPSLCYVSYVCYVCHVILFLDNSA